MKAYSKDLKLKELAAVDRGMARQGVAYTREAHRGGHPECSLISQAGVRSGWLTHCGYEPQDQNSSRPLSDFGCSFLQNPDRGLEISHGLGQRRSRHNMCAIA